MLKLFRSEKVNLRNMLLLVSPVFVLTVLYILAFIRETDSITLASYVEFIKLGSANFLSGTLLVCLLIELMVVGFWLYREMSRYNRLLGDYYTDNHIEDGHKVYSIMLAFTIYIVTTFFFFFSENAVHRLVNEPEYVLGRSVYCRTDKPPAYLQSRFAGIHLQRIATQE